MKPIVVKLKNDANKQLKWLYALEIAEKAIVKVHTYEHELGLFRVKVGKTIIVEEL